jgi:hypothetical protein
MLLAGPGLAADWRLEFLKQEGIGTTPEALGKAAARFGKMDVNLRQTYERLGAEEFHVREQAGRDIQRGGADALQWLKNQPESDDPEIRERVRTILDAMETPGLNVRETALNYAVKSLLEEAGKEPDKATGGMFYEGFTGSLKATEKTYGSFEVEAAHGMPVTVTDGRLVMGGKRPGDDHQRLVLRAAKWPGAKTFPKHFQVSANLGGTKGDAGAWHMGLAVGRVRALFHPGMEGGSFRFERVDNRQELTTNEGMGFTPAMDAMQRMSLDVRVLENGDVKLEARVTSKDGKIFKRSCEVPADAIGPLDRVSLDRSGRTGGDALFDDFIVETK